MERFFEPLVPKFLEKLMNRAILKFFLQTLLRVGVLKESEIKSTYKIHPRTLQVEEEAQKRGLKVSVITHYGRPTNLFVLRGQGKPYYFEGLPGYQPDFTTDIDHKEKARKKLMKIGVPTPQGGVFISERKALRFAEVQGYPLVVKPNHSSLSRHVSVNIRNIVELKEAIRIVKQISFSFIVEEFLEGSYFRATAIGDHVHAVCRRDPPSKPLENAPAWKFSLDLGGTVHDVTRTTHPDNLVLFEKIAREVNHPALGIDFIAPSISESWKNQKCGVIELNSLPAIDLHTAPIVQGESRNLAGALLDHVLKMVKL
ncbi:MAG: hypothetical protein V1908_00160 [Candidatus Peregrinibacteria bacterium]